MSFYRTYRPQTIDDIDNAAVREKLLSLLTKDKKDLPHAFLFSGPRGAGKTTAARIIAKLFNCEKPNKSGPCGKCGQCVTVAEGRNLDVLEIDAASNRGIDEIRQLRDAIALAPSAASYKIYIIDEVHMLTTEAFNALLKTLEEPPAHAVFVLATTDPQKVPVTIKSRCVSIVFTRAKQDELIAALKRIVGVEKISIDDDALRLIADSVDGSFRDAVKFLEQLSFVKGKISRKNVNEMLSLGTEGSVANFIGKFLNKQPKDALDDIAVLVSSGVDIKSFLVQCLTYLEQELVGQIKGVLPERWGGPAALREAIKKLSQAYAEMKFAAIAQLPLELAIVEYCEDAVTVDATKVFKPETRVEPKVKNPDASKATEEPTQTQEERKVISEEAQLTPSLGLLTLEKLSTHWPDFIAEMKPYNHSIAGVLRSTRPKTVDGGIVTIEAFYSFHKDKLSEPKTREMLGSVLKRLFGEKVKVDIVLGKK